MHSRVPAAEGLCRTACTGGAAMLASRLTCSGPATHHRYLHVVDWRAPVGTGRPLCGGAGPSVARHAPAYRVRGNLPCGTSPPWPPPPPLPAAHASCARTVASLCKCAARPKPSIIAVRGTAHSHPCVLPHCSKVAALVHVYAEAWPLAQRHQVGGTFNEEAALAAALVSALLLCSCCFPAAEAPAAQQEGCCYAGCGWSCLSCCHEDLPTCSDTLL